MKHIHRKPRFLQEAKFIEYALIVCLIVLAIVGAFFTFGVSPSKILGTTHHLSDFP